jgi:hypothetical protein
MMQVTFFRKPVKHLARTCPRCGGFFGLMVGSTSPEGNVSFIRGACLRCGYQIDWRLIRGGR